MREPTLKETALASILIHALVFFSAMITMKKSAHLTPYRVYTVKLVSPSKPTPSKPEATKEKGKKGSTVSAVSRIKTLKAKRRKKIMAMKKTYRAKRAKLKKEKPLDTSHVEEQIEKLKALSHIKRLSRLKHQVLSISKTEGAGEAEKKKTGGSSLTGKSKQQSSGEVLKAYMELAQRLIWNEWTLPEIKEVEGLETVVVIKILLDGKVLISGIERSSGDSLFDRSALRAIMKASPLPPPPEEMELGIRFRP